MVQPNIVPQLLADAELAGQGILSRILPAAPASTAGTRMFRKVIAEDQRCIDAYSERMLSILKTPLSTDGAGGLTPRTLRFSPAAARAWEIFFNLIEGQVGKGGDLHEISAFA